jgi:hypothetical protein
MSACPYDAFSFSVRRIGQKCAVVACVRCAEPYELRQRQSAEVGMGHSPTRLRRLHFYDRGFELRSLIAQLGEKHRLIARVISRTGLAWRAGAVRYAAALEDLRQN